MLCVGVSWEGSVDWIDLYNNYFVNAETGRNLRADGRLEFIVGEWYGS